MAGAIIDAHIHIWDFERASYSWLENDRTILRRNYHIDELENERLEAGVTGGILVQAANNLEDTDWMLAVAGDVPWIKGVIGWLPLTDPDETGRLLEETYARNPWFKGVRHLIHDEADPRWLLQDTVIESLRLLEKAGLVYEIVGVIPAHIETALRVAEEVPGLRMVFDHLNQPPISTGRASLTCDFASGAGALFGQWGELMKTAAGSENFFVKVSGLGTASHMGDRWQAEDIAPYVEFVLKHYGEGRCWCGGDWPVSLLAGNYTTTWKIYRQVLSGLLSEDAQERVLLGNARDFYRLSAD